MVAPGNGYHTICSKILKLVIIETTKHAVVYIFKLVHERSNSYYILSISFGEM